MWKVPTTLPSESEAFGFGSFFLNKKKFREAADLEQIHRWQYSSAKEVWEEEEASQRNDMFLKNKKVIWSKKKHNADILN